jgi:hypothetical protein
MERQTVTIDFDKIIDRRNTHSSKWDNMQAGYGVSPDTGIPMWVADMDFRPPEQVDAALTGGHGAWCLWLLRQSGELCGGAFWLDGAAA